MLGENRSGPLLAALSRPAALSPSSPTAATSALAPTAPLFVGVADSSPENTPGEKLLPQLPSSALPFCEVASSLEGWITGSLCLPSSTTTFLATSSTTSSDFLNEPTPPSVVAPSSCSAGLLLVYTAMLAPSPLLPTFNLPSSLSASFSLLQVGLPARGALSSPPSPPAVSTACASCVAPLAVEASSITSSSPSLPISSFAASGSLAAVTSVFPPAAPATSAPPAAPAAAAVVGLTPGLITSLF
mmetsp:Transcript_7056/g.8103  ORF Transcript_7056/g.8103 Transcript_7056/m.8103 type:complete len:244 (-) Transcript_7056:2322-3053(-)